MGNKINRTKQFRLLGRELAKQGFTRKQVARALGVSLSSVEQWLSGEKQPNDVNWQRIIKLKRYISNDGDLYTLLERQVPTNEKPLSRLLYSSISTSVRVSSLGPKGALIYTWLLAHTDEQGNYYGGTKKIKAEVVPMIDQISKKDILNAITQMHRCGLVTVYANERVQVIQITDWRRYQNATQS